MKSGVHLSPEEFIDLAEGARSEASRPHLAACERCRAELADLRRAMAVAGEAEVPEPSPLFWQNLSARIGERVDAEANRSWWSGWMRPRVLIPVSAVAMLALVIAVASKPTPVPQTTASKVAVAPANDNGDLADDPLLTLVSDLSANMDLESASAAGFAARDSAEQAVTHMSADELTALKRLLQAEMTRSGA